MDLWWVNFPFARAYANHSRCHHHHTTSNYAIVRAQHRNLMYFSMWITGIWNTVGKIYDDWKLHTITMMLYMCMLFVTVWMCGLQLRVGQEHVVLIFARCWCKFVRGRCICYYAVAGNVTAIRLHGIRERYIFFSFHFPLYFASKATYAHLGGTVNLLSLY